MGSCCAASHAAEHHPFRCAQCLMVAAKEDKEDLERLVQMNTRLVALCANHDSIEADEEGMAKAAQVYSNLLSSVRVSVCVWGGGGEGDFGALLLCSA